MPTRSAGVSVAIGDMADSVSLEEAVQGCHLVLHFAATTNEFKPRAYFERVQHGRPERRKIALVATAHYLLRCMHAMLVQNQPWQEAA